MAIYRVIHNQVTLEDALEIIRYMQPLAKECNYYLALAGGVLNKGYSRNDLDIIAVPATSDNDYTALIIKFDFHFKRIPPSSFSVRDRSIDVHHYITNRNIHIDVAMINLRAKEGIV